MKSFAWILFFGGMLPAAEPAGFYAMSDFADNWKVSKSFTLEVAQAMPEEHYRFKASPDEMSFGALMIHIAGAQAFRFAQVAGVKSPIPDQMPRDITKAQIIELLSQSFDFCAAQLPNLTAKQLEQSYEVKWRGRPTATGRMILMNMFVHTAHHRAQAEVYLRMKGVTPPFYSF